MGLIYCATFPNNKKYVGQTTRTLQERINEHKYQANQIPIDNIFHKAINKYGANNIDWSILEDNINTIEELNAKEEYWIQKLNTYFENKQGYNMTLGGQNYLNRCLIDSNSELVQQIYEDYKICGSTILLSDKYHYGINTINQLLKRMDENWKQYSHVGQGKSYKFNQQEAMQIYTEYKTEGRIDILANRYHVNRSVIRDTLKRIDPNYSVFQKKGRFTIAQENEIIAYYQNCGSIKQTKEHFNVSWETIAKIVKQ